MYDRRETPLEVSVGQRIRIKDRTAIWTDKDRTEHRERVTFEGVITKVTTHQAEYTVTKILEAHDMLHAPTGGGFSRMFDQDNMTILDAPALMTFEEFQATRETDIWLFERVPFENYEEGNPTRGNIYCKVLSIEDSCTWEGSRDGVPDDDGRWLVTIGNDQLQSNDLEEIERILYQYALKEGFAGK